MTHRQKVDNALAELAQNGIDAFTVAPPIFRLAWRLGLEFPPPHFLSFLSLALFMGSFYGFFMAGAAWLLVCLPLKLGMGPALVGGALGGILFGLCMAAYYRWQASKLRLPSWNEYPVA